MAKKNFKIGFVQPDAEDPKEDEKEVKPDHLREAIERVWSPTGETQHMDFYSPVMIKEFLTEWIYGSLKDINDKMKELGFKSTNIDGMHCWVVYEKNHFPDDINI